MTQEFVFGGQDSGEEGDKVVVDYKGMEKYLVETVNCESPEILTGVISCIVDLGQHEQEPAMVDSDLTPEQEQEALDAWKAPFLGAERFWFETVKDDVGNEKRVKRWKVYNREVAVAVDFPDLIVDKAKWFGEESKPLPLRLWLGTSFFNEYLGERGMMVASGTRLNFMRDFKSTDKTKTLHPLSTIRKMSVAAKITTEKEPISVSNIGKVLTELLGKSLQFTVTVKLNKGKYYDENVKFSGALGRGMSEYDLQEFGVTPFIVNLNTNNNEEAVKNLPAKVRTRLRMSRDFNNSALQAQIAQIHGEQLATSLYSGNKPQGVTVATKSGGAEVVVESVSKPKAEVVDDFDDQDLPF